MDGPLAAIWGLLLREGDGRREVMGEGKEGRAREGEGRGPQPDCDWRTSQTSFVILLLSSLIGDGGLQLQCVVITTLIISDT